MSTESLCQHNGGVSTIPGIDPSSLYCVTPNVANTTSISNMSQACCDFNPLQKMGGCDYCIINYPTSWSNTSDEDSIVRGWAGCLSTQASLDETNQTVRASWCHLPGDSAGVAVSAGRPGWAVWGLVAVVGFGLVEGGLL